MVHALVASSPFMNGGSLSLYHPPPVENFLAIAPGIEVSVEPHDNPSARSNVRDSSIYNRQGKIIALKKKGHFIDCVL